MASFLNNKDEVIEPAFFIDYIYQFHMHPCFILKLKTKNWLNLDENQAQTISEKSTDRNIWTESTLKRCNAAIGPDLYVTSDSLKAYINKKSYGDILLVEYERKGTLTDTERRKLISYLSAFVEGYVGLNPTSQELEAASQAFLSLFPCLKSSGRNETELLVNRSNTGYLQIKLKNDRAKRKKLDNSVVLPSSSIEIFNDSQIQNFQQDLNELQMIKTVSWIEYFTHYRPELFVISPKYNSTHNINNFCQIKCILAYKNEFIFICKKFRVIQFCEFHNPFQITEDVSEDSVLLLPLHAYDNHTSYDSSFLRKTNGLYIVTKHYF